MSRVKYHAGAFGGVGLLLANWNVMGVILWNAGEAVVIRW